MNGSAATSTDTVERYLAEPLRLGESTAVENLAIYPLFGPEPRLGYTCFAQAREGGVRIGELEGGASVNDLVIENRGGEVVFLLEGEEVIGAQQNRTFDVSALIAPGVKTQVPVSCMEAGRWEGHRHGEEMRPASQTANPRIRRAKALQIRRSVMAGMAARASQGDVWDEVAEEQARHGSDSATSAMHDVYESRRGRLHEIVTAVPRQDDQVGSIAAINGEMWVLDYVSRPDVYASLHERLVQGYSLDALAEQNDGPAEASPEDSTARGFVLLACDAPIGHRAPGIGLGEEIRCAANGVSGSGLAHGGELIQLSVFPGEEDGDADAERGPRQGRVRRRSRRRGR
jgi:hypothetical protein